MARAFEGVSSHATERWFDLFGNGASRSPQENCADPIEAPYLFSHGGYYYLLASYDYCCKGVNSTYYTVVGRAKDIRGPYLGEDGSSMMDGGGTVILKADLQEKGRFRGPGHAAWLSDGGTDYIVYHAYDKEHDGAPTLRIAPIRCSTGFNGWRKRGAATCIRCTPSSASAE